MKNGNGLTPKQQAFIYGIRSFMGVYFYVGSTKSSLDIRLKQHLQQVKNDTHQNRLFARRVKEVGCENCVIDLLEITTPALRFAKEYAWIADFQVRSIRLTNIIRSVEQEAKLHGKESRQWKRAKVFVSLVKHAFCFYMKFRQGRWSNRWGTITPRMVQMMHDEVQDRLVKDAAFSIEHYGQEAFNEALTFILESSSAREFGVCTALQRCA